MHEADSTSGGEEIEPVGTRMRRRPAGSGERTNSGKGFSLFKPWERVGCKPNQECSLNVRWLQGGCWLAVPSCPRQERKWQEEVVAVQGKPLTEECRWKNAATCFFLTLKNWGGGGVSGNRKDFMDPRKTGFQHANVTRKRTGSHFQLRMHDPGQ